MAKDMLRSALEYCITSMTSSWRGYGCSIFSEKGNPETSLYSLLQDAIRRGSRLFDMSGGDQVRDFLPIDEAARLIIDAALLKGNTGTLNVCSGEPKLVRSLVKSWIDESGSRITMNLGRLPYTADNEPMAFWGSRAKLDTLLGGAREHT